MIKLPLVQKLKVTGCIVLTRESKKPSSAPFILMSDKTEYLEEEQENQAIED